LREEHKLQLFINAVPMKVFATLRMKHVSKLRCYIPRNFVLYTGYRLLLLQENLGDMNGWVCDQDGKDKEFLYNFGWEISWKSIHLESMETEM
jgi:hypothetical protein